MELECGELPRETVPVGLGHIIPVLLAGNSNSPALSASST